MLKSKDIEKFEDWNDVKKRLFTKDELAEIERESALMIASMTELQECVSKEVAAYMAKEGIGFNELSRRLKAGPTHTSRIVKGNCNLTMASIADLASVIGKKAKVVFE